MNRFKHYIYILSIVFAITSCSKPVEPIEISPEVFHASVDKVMEIQIHDIFSPPVASRVFVYPNISAYEILAQKTQQMESLEGKLKELSAIPLADSSKDINLELAAIIAHMELSKSLIFSEEKMEVLQDSLYADWKEKNEPEFNSAKTYAFEVINHIKQWMDNDNYNQNIIDSGQATQIITGS